MVLAFACTGYLWVLSRSRGISLMQLTGHVVSCPEKVLIEGLLVDAADYELWFQLENAWRGLKWSGKTGSRMNYCSKHVFTLQVAEKIILRSLIRNTMMHMWIVVKQMVVDVHANNRTKAGKRWVQDQAASCFLCLFLLYHYTCSDKKEISLPYETVQWDSIGLPRKATLPRPLWETLDQKWK